MSVFKKKTLPGIFGSNGGSQYKATHSSPLGKAPPSLAVRQQPRILKSTRNTTQPVRPHVGTSIYHIGSLQNYHILCDPPVVPLLVAV
jgi:hypothetical protein